MNWTAGVLLSLGGLALIIGVRGNGRTVWTAVTGLETKPPKEVLFPTNLGGSSSADFGTPTIVTGTDGKVATPISNPIANPGTSGIGQTPMQKVRASIISVVDPMATRQGIPSALWENIVQQESGFNQNAVGDSGSSWGLFQLHRGGQADYAFSQGKTIDDLLNPAINAQYGLPAIAAAWRQLGNSFNDSLSWWEAFGGASGHPGGQPGNIITDQYAARIKALYDQGIFGRI